MGKSIPPCFDSSKYDAHIVCYKKFTISSNIAKRKSEGEGKPTLNNTKRMQRSGEGAKQLFPIECRISIYSGSIVRFNNIKEDGECWKFFPMINC